METKEFLKPLYSSGIEFNNLTKILSIDEALNNTTDNIYFLSGIKQGLNKRASDNDIVSKKYFAIDVDLKKQAPFEIEYTDIIKEGLNIAQNLSLENSLLGKWRYIVYSGNGLHIYYSFEKQSVSKEDYALAVTNFFEIWDDFWGDKIYYSDRACKNIGRILRLPGSINQKNGMKVEVLASQDIDIDFNIEEIANKVREEQTKRYEEEAKRNADRLEIQIKLEALKNNEKYVDSTKKNIDLFKKLNSIPAYIVSEKLLPQFKFRKNNRNFLSDEPNKGNRFTAFFYSESMNGIVNGGSSWYNWGSVDSCWSNSNLIKNHLNLSWKEVIQYAKENFKI